MQQNTISFHKLGLDAIAGGDLDQAVESFREASKLAPDNALIYLDMAGALQKLGRFAEAEAACREALSIDSELGKAHRILGLIARDRKDSLGAIAHFEDARDLTATDVWNTFDIAQEYRALGQYHEAIVHYRAAVAAKANFAEAYRCMGWAHLALKAYDQALESFQRASALVPDNPWNYFEMAGILRRLGRLDEAEAACRQALSIDSSLGKIHRTLGLIARDRKDRLGAIAYFEEASNHTTNDVWNTFDIAQEYRALGRYDEAITYYRAALGAKPDLVEAYRCMGWTEIARGDIPASQGHFADALRLLESADAAKPGQSLIAIVEMLLQLGRIEDAKGRLNTAEISSLTRPAAAEVFRLRAAVARKMADYDEELACLRVTLALSRDQRRSWLTLVERQVALGMLHDAGITIEEACCNFPDDPDLVIEGARIRRLRGRLDESREQLGKLRLANGLTLQSRIRLANELRYNNMLLEAQQIARSAIALEPTNIAAQLSLVLADLEISGPAAAVAQLQDIITLGSDDSEVIYHASRLLRDTGNAAAALQLVEDKTSTWRAPTRIFQELMLNLIQVNSLDRARAFLELRKELSPDDPDNLCTEIDLEIAAGNIKRVEELFVSICQRPITHARTAARVVHMARAFNDFEIVISTHMRWIALDPLRTLPGMIAVAEAEYNLGNRDRAYAILNDLAGKFGAVPDISLMRAQLLRAGGAANEALATLDGCFKKYPDNIALWAELIQLAIYTGDLGFAATVLNAEMPPTLKWREERALLEIELSFARHDFKTCLDQVNGFTPSYVRNRRNYYNLASMAALAVLDIPLARQFLGMEMSLLRSDKRLRGKSTNIRRSLMGQLIDEFRLDQATVTALKQANGLAPDQRPTYVLSVARSKPESTAAAITAIQYLRQQGQLGQKAGARGSAIPKRIAQFWATPDVPADISGYMETWRRFNQGWSYNLFDVARAYEFIASHCTSNVLAAFSRASDMTVQADIFRLAWLSEGGGVYADPHDVCIESLDNSLTSNLRFLGYQEDVGSIGNNFLATIPGHPVISWALEEASNAILRGDSEIAWLCTGPGLISRAFIHWIALQPNLSEPLGETIILDRGEFAGIAVPRCHTIGKFTSNVQLKEVL